MRYHDARSFDTIQIHSIQIHWLPDPFEYQTSLVKVSDMYTLVDSL